MSGNNKISVSVRNLNIGKFVALVKINGDDAALPDVLVFINIRALDNTFFRYHAKISAVFILRNFNHCGNRFALFKRQQVHNIHALARSGGGGNFVCLFAENLARVCEKEHNIVRGAAEHRFCHILFTAAHAHNASSAAILSFIGVNRHALHIAHVGEGEYGFLNGDKVFIVNRADNGAYFRSAVVVKFINYFLRFGFDNIKNSAFVCENILVICNFFFKLCQFVCYFFNFKPCKLAELEVYNCRCLRIVKAEFFHNGKLCFAFAALAGSDCGYNFIHNINCLAQAVQNMRSCHCFV